MEKLIKLPLLRISELLCCRQISSLELTTFYLDRIEEIDGNIGAYLTVNAEQAKKRAEESDQRRRRAEALGELDGIPFAAKDNISCAGVLTSCASKMLEGYISPYDATVIKKLKDSGAILLGKTNMDEFAMGSLNLNSAFGITRNPLDERRAVGGSSGGSAACVSASLAAFALGSDTGGSVRLPASYCGLCGLKPTYGAVSRYGLVAYASSFDVIGPICKTASDAALVFSAIRGRDERDATSIETEDASIRPLREMRVALPQECFDVKMDEGVKDAVLACVSGLEGLGMRACEVSVPSYAVSLSAYYVICMAEASSNLARYDGIRYGKRTERKTASIEEFIATNRSEGFGEEVKRRILVGTYVLSDGYIDMYYKKAQDARRRLCEEIGRVFEECDLILLPVSPFGPPLISEAKNEPLDESYGRDAFNVLANMTGLPSVTVSCGRDKNGMPAGVQLVGKAGSENVLLYFAQEIEKLSSGRKEEQNEL